MFANQPCETLYANRTMCVNRTCSEPRMFPALRRAHHVDMSNAPEKPRHFLREWRKHREMSLEQVAERVMLLGVEERFRLADPDSRPKTMTHATLSRIERGLLPYNQLLLEILADIYGTSPASLLMRDPSTPDAPWSLADQIVRLTDAKRRQVIAFLAALDAA